MPVTVSDPRPRRSLELMDYVSEGTEGQWAEHFGASTEAVVKYKKMMAKSEAQEKQELETETGKQIRQGFEGVAEGLAAAFAPKKAPPKRERPTIPMKYVEKGTQGQWDDPEPSWKDEEDSDYRVHPAGRYVGSTRIKDEYVEEGTHGQNWDLIRLGMDARGQERAQQEQEMGRSKGSRGHFDAGHV